MLSSDHIRLRADAMEHPTLVDDGTGLANRLHFELVYNYIFEAGDRGLAFTVMLVEAVPGDGVASRDVGQAMKRTTRTSDLVAHVGGAGYAVLLLGTNLQGARIAADRVELALEELTAQPPAFGLAAYGPDHGESVQLLHAAEAALQAAREAGGGLEFG